MISVCLLTYNGAKYIREQLESILIQLGQNDEIIVSDNCSTDTTIDIVKSLKDSRIKIYSYEKHSSCFKGPMKLCYDVGRNAENALSKAKGDYIFLSDQDDVWLEGKIDRCINELGKSDLVITNHITVNQNLEPIVDLKNLKKVIKPTICNTFTSTQFLGCCMAFRRNLLDFILPFPKEPLMHDIWIGIMALKYGTIGIVQEPFLLYRRHGDNASINIEEKSPNPLSFKLLYRWYLLKSYLKR